MKNPTLKITVDTEAFAENLTDTLQDAKDSELTLSEKEKVLDELENLEEKMKKLKESLLNS
jgi:hypothetical protein